MRHANVSAGKASLETGINKKVITTKKRIQIRNHPKKKPGDAASGEHKLRQMLVFICLARNKLPTLQSKCLRVLTRAASSHRDDCVTENVVTNDVLVTRVG